VKQKVHPAVIGTLLAVVIGVVVYFGYKTAMDKPVYPGLSAKNAARGDRTDISSPTSAPKNAEDARKMGIPGAVPGGH